MSEPQSEQQLTRADVRMLFKFLAEYLAPRSRYERTLTPSFSITLNSSGAGTVVLGHAPVGKTWELERLFFEDSGDGSPSFRICVGQPITGAAPATSTLSSMTRSMQPALAGPPTSGQSTAAFIKPIFVNPGEYVTLIAASGTTSGTIVGTVQIKQSIVSIPTLAL